MAEELLPEGVEASEHKEPHDTALATAMALTRAGGKGADAAESAAFLREQRALVGLQRAHFEADRRGANRAAAVKLLSDRLKVATQIFVAAIATAVTLMVAGLMLSAVRSRNVLIEAFKAPPALAARGLSGEVVAGAVQDGLVDMQAATRSSGGKRTIANAWSNDIKVEAPYTGISIGELDRLLHDRLGHDTHVAGDLVQQPDGRVTLSIRGDGIPAKSFTGAEADIPKLARTAAEYVYGVSEARLFSIFLNQQGRGKEAIDFVRAAYPQVPDRDRPDLINAWGNALLSMGDYPGARNRFRLAVQLKPDRWASWANLIVTTTYIDGQEAGLRIAREVEAAGAARPRSDRPSRFDLEAIDRLTQNWSQHLAGLKGDAQVTGGGGTTNIFAGPSLAEDESHLHNWRAAERHLNASPTDAPETRLEWLQMQGLRAIEAGAPERAVSFYEPLAKAWRADASVRFGFPDVPCDLGLAYGLSGQLQMAEAAFAEGGRWVSCYSNRALALEHAGDRAGADAAHAAAVALAPSLPFPYHRWGVTLAARGDVAGAAARFAQAHQRGPKWADPLKSWGDLLARQGRWKEALAKYDEALADAPAWYELRQARAVAVARAPT
jgi:tetratricopeptide (TPR) repeat protein